MDLSIVIVNWNSRELLEQCLRSLAATGTRCSYEVIVSDNGSTDGSREWLARVAQANPQVQCVFNDDNPGFGVGNNRALPFCRGRYVLFLNADTILTESLDDLIAAADAIGPACGAVGGRVLNADKTIQLSCRERFTLPVLIASYTLAFAGLHPGVIRRQQLADWDHASLRDVGTLSGCYLLVPAHVLREVGGFDPQIFLYFEDTDLCYRIRRAGYRITYAPVSAIIHLEGGASRDEGVTLRGLSSSVQSARYFTRAYLGAGQERILTLTVGLAWTLMWLLFAPMGLLWPQAGPRAKARQRAKLLWGALGTMARTPLPPPPTDATVALAPTP
ncbi:MAG TPA: glycosyltransferase family 2 protein [Ktedonobacterales bacterium]|nr:glycosyltransferase family 2 protein [Ktedonobacterales bacterium]